MKLPIPFIGNAERVRSAGRVLRFAAIPLVVILLLMLLNSRVQLQVLSITDVRSGFDVLLSYKWVGLENNNGRGRPCDVYKGKWVPYEGEAYYTNSTCSLIIDQVNCFKFGRPDSGFLRWRWKPDGCELPRFDALRFLDLVRGKSMAFVGDSLGRNQMNSLQCLLSKARIHNLPNNRGKRPQHNFTVAEFWAPFLVTTVDPDPSDHSASKRLGLRLDVPEDSWASEVENFDFVILSAGIWLFHPFVFYEKGRVVGCNTDSCVGYKMANLGIWYAFRKAFRTTFETLLRKKGYKGVTFLRSYSPSHFENGPWNNGGTCTRTEPLTSIKEARSMPEQNEMNAYLAPIEEFRKAEKAMAGRGLTLKLMDTTDAMLLRADAHPNIYRNASVADCVHWCLPGPVDTWNEFLQYHLMSL
ncbi:hypothetical protein MLD38_001250 [Melastoma candidum]|uniref:Uncharacterized protein n=1 Tax=Melastoma candidum TaxID=119954 RepID=A0ACB9SDL2_9MYRT|nr:hypothetical protein MLD38_001250 [Melastoma candidum]